jgi:hypothetical protein
MNFRSPFYFAATSSIAFAKSRTPLTFNRLFGSSGFS